MDRFIFKFSVNDIAVSQFVHFGLFDADNIIFFEGYGEFEMLVPKGYYILRISINTHQEEREYRIAEDTYDSLKEINISSSIPFSLGKKKYLSICAQKESRQATGNTLGIYDSSLFVFIQQTNNDTCTILYQEYSILNHKRDLIVSFSDDNIKTGTVFESDTNTHWVSTNIKLPPGQYFICCFDKIQFEIAVYIYSSWQTQVFLIYDTKPMLSSLRLTMQRNVIGFDPDNKYHIKYDALLQKMYNGIYYIPDIITREINDVVLEYPMLGFAFCYVLLAKNRPLYSSQVRSTILHLHRHVLHSKSPDIASLYGRRNEDSNYSDYIHPTTFYEGMHLMFSDGHFDSRPTTLSAAFGNILIDSIWTIYSPHVTNDIRTQGIDGNIFVGMREIIDSVQYGVPSETWRNHFIMQLQTVKIVTHITETNWLMFFSSIQEGIPYFKKEKSHFNRILDIVDDLCNQFEHRVKSDIQMIWPFLAFDVMCNHDILNGRMRKKLEQLSIPIDSLPQAISKAVFESDNQCRPYQDVFSLNEYLNNIL